MSLEAILESIEGDARAETGRRIEAATAAAAALRAEAGAAAERRIEAALAAAEPALRAEAARLVNVARLRQLRRRADTSAERADAVWRAAADRIDAIVAEAGPRWHAALTALAGEALAMAGPGAVVAIREPDAPVIAGIVAAHGGQLEILPPGAPAGPHVRSAGGGLEVDATIATRLERARSSLAGR